MAPLQNHTHVRQASTTRPIRSPVDNKSFQLLSPELGLILDESMVTVTLWFCMLFFADVFRDRRPDYSQVFARAMTLVLSLGVYLWLLCLTYATHVIGHILVLAGLCWATRKRIFYSRYRYDPKPLITPRYRIGQGDPGDDPPVLEYLAVDVTAVDYDDLKGGVLIRSLPLHLVQVPSEEKSHIAVLSWRWDFEHDAFQEPSHNVACAIQYAKRQGVRYLFIDIISLDQTVSPQELIPQVARFGTLYETIPVIAVYEDRCLRFSDVFARPWIHSEVKSMLRNPYEVVYVRHRNYQRRRSIIWWIVEHSGISDERESLLQLGWASPHATPVLQILNGTNQMADIHDFKFIYPMLAEPVIVAEQLDRNDYLMTVALLTIASSYGRTQRLLMETTFTMLVYKKFWFISDVTEKHFPGFILHEENHEVYWKDIKLATFWCHEKRRRGHPIFTRYDVRFSWDLERHIFAMLGLNREAYIRYMANEQKRRTSMLGEQVQQLYIEGHTHFSESYIKLVNMTI